MKRSKTPKITKQISISHIDPLVTRLKNSVPLYMIQAGSQPVIRIDFVFNAGSWWQSKALMASSTNAMLSEGTKKLTGKDVAEKLDYHGAYLYSSTDRDNAFISLFSLTKAISIILPLLAEIIKTPAFPEQEFQTYKERYKQNFFVEKEKVNNLARERFALSLYGSKHPYGRLLSASDFNNISREDLQEFHSGYYTSANCSIIVSGRYNPDELIKKMDKLFGEDDWPSAGIIKNDKVRKRPAAKKQIFITKKDSVQSAIRVGRELFNRKHPDYPGILVLNSILGGHFGSRLMQNIREKKGYTYGIGSTLVSYRNSGFLVIISEVGAGYWKKALIEIYKELHKLCCKPVSKRELELTRSYMLGNLLRGFDGPFACAESIRKLVEHDMDTGFYRTITKTINNIGPPEILNLAIKYMSADMYEVVAGNK